MGSDTPFMCPVCGCGIVQLSMGSYVVSIRNRSYSLAEVEAPRCGECGEVFVTPEEAEALGRQACDAIRQQKQLLSPGELRAFRAEYGLSQRDLEAILRVAPKSVVRWERGNVFQSPSTDAFIRHLMAHPGEIARRPAAICVTVQAKKPLRGRSLEAEYAVLEARPSPDDMLVDDGNPAAA